MNAMGIPLRPAPQFFDRPAAHAGHLIGLPQGVEPSQGCPGDIDRISRAQRLRQDVFDARRLQHGPYRASRDDPSARGRGTQEHPRRPEGANHLMRDRGAVASDAQEALLGVLHGFADRVGHLAGLPQADADGTALVADNHQRAELEPLRALGDLGDTVDEDRLLDGQVDTRRIDACWHVIPPEDQNSRPPARAASASARTRPWYRYPPRSKTTEVIPLALARCASSSPTAAAASVFFLPATRWRISTSRVEAEARVRPLS